MSFLDEVRKASYLNKEYVQQVEYIKKEIIECCSCQKEFKHFISGGSEIKENIINYFLEEGFFVVSEDSEESGLCLIVISGW